MSSSFKYEKISLPLIKEVNKVWLNNPFELPPYIVPTGKVYEAKHPIINWLMQQLIKRKLIKVSDSFSRDDIERVWFKGKSEIQEVVEDFFLKDGKRLNNRKKS